MDINEYIFFPYKFGEITFVKVDFAKQKKAEFYRKVNAVLNA